MRASHRKMLRAADEEADSRTICRLQSAKMLRTRRKQALTTHDWCAAAPLDRGG
jgi:hypothetical protein